MMMPFKYFYDFKIMFDHVKLRFNAVNTVYYFVNMLGEQCMLMHIVFRNNQEACAIIGTNKVHVFDCVTV